MTPCGLECGRHLWMAPQPGFFFAGNSELDQLYKVCSVLGTPSRGDWPDGFVLASGMSFHFPNFSQTHLSQVSGHFINFSWLSQLTLKSTNDAP